MWRQDSDESSATDSEDDTTNCVDHASINNSNIEEAEPVKRTKQTNLMDYFNTAMTTGSTTSIDGMSSDGLEAYSDESSADSYSDMTIQPSAGLDQPEAGPGQPSPAGPSAGSTRPSAESVDTAATDQ